MADEQILTLRELFSKAVIPQEYYSLEKSEAIIQQARKYQTTVENIEYLVSSIKEKRIDGPLVLATVYLFAFEGLYTSQVDCVVFLLVCYGHDLYDSVRGRYADDMAKIKKVDIQSKFRFLKQHGFEKIVNKHAQDIRNGIAHNEFEFLENSKIKIGDKKYDLALELGDLINHVNELIREFADLYNKQPHVKISSEV